MLKGIDGQRLLTTVPQELRWMDNPKKGFYESDVAYVDGPAPQKPEPPPQERRIEGRRLQGRL
jgi:hypothetical protein